MLDVLLTETAEKLGTDIQWGWDERWNTALMVLQGEDGSLFLTNLDDVFGSAWNVDNIASAEAAVQALAEDMGGLRAGQRLYSRSVDDGALLYAASWPWVGKSHLSIRIGVYGGDHNRSVRTVFAPDSFRPES